MAKIKLSLSGPTPSWAKKVRTYSYKTFTPAVVIGIGLWTARTYFPGLYSHIPADISDLENTLLGGGISAFLLNFIMQSMTDTTQHGQQNTDNPNP